jgi:PAS domain S-box-containing protein
LLSAGRWEGELVQTTAQGSRVVVASRWTLQRDEQNRPVMILETNNDITTRKRAEDALRLQANLLEQTHDAVLVWELPGTIVYWNHGAEQLYGFLKDEAIGRSSHKLLRTEHPMPTELFEPLIERQGTWVGELTQMTRDGRKIVVETRHVLKREDGRRLVLETNRDITERKRAEQALRESEQRYRYIFESTRVSIWEEDFTLVAAAIQELKAKGVQDFRRYLAEHPEFIDKAISMVRIVDVNQATAELFGAQNKDELLISLDRIFTPETREVFAGELIALAEGRTWFESQTSLQTLRGDRTSVIFTIAFPTDAAKLNSVLVSIMDISEQKRAEEALRQSQADLAHMNRVTTLGELTASLAHEVNQPITAAVTNANTCLRWLTRSEPDLDEARQAAARTVKDAIRAAEVISRTRSLFKKAGPQREVVDLNDLIREMMLLLHNEAHRFSISIRPDLAPNLPKTMADRVQLQQVFMNLMMNSIDAMKDTNARGELTIRSQQSEDGHLLVSLSDTGVGLPPGKADQIFNAFFTSKSQGTGLGLTISRSIIESHGGRLWAEQNSPRGATFLLSLPSKPETRA